jgi:HEAT repeat protein
MNVRAVTSALIEALRDEDDRVRVESVKALAAFGPWAGPSAPATVAAALKDRSIAVRRAAAFALRGFGAAAEGTISALDAAMRDDDPTVHKAAAESKRAIEADSKEVARIVHDHVEKMQSKDAARRESAAESLSRMGPRARPAIPALTRLLADEDEEVRNAARAALRNIGPTSSVPAAPPDKLTRGQAVPDKGRVTPPSSAEVDQ